MRKESKISKIACTDVLKLKSFGFLHSPNRNFLVILDKLMNRYEEKLLEGDAGGTKEQRHYG